MSILEMAKEKWAKKTAAAISKWQAAVSNPATFRSYVAGIASVTGLPESTVAASLPARNYKEFQANVHMFAEKYKAKVTHPAAKEKWAQNYRRAFTTG